jgi:hypothetical protein
VHVPLPSDSYHKSDDQEIVEDINPEILYLITQLCVEQSLSNLIDAALETEKQKDVKELPNSPRKTQYAEPIIINNNAEDTKIVCGTITQLIEGLSSERSSTHELISKLLHEMKEKNERTNEREEKLRGEIVDIYHENSNMMRTMIERSESKAKNYQDTLLQLLNKQTNIQEVKRPQEDIVNYSSITSEIIKTIGEATNTNIGLLKRVANEGKNTQLFFHF